MGERNCRNNDRECRAGELEWFDEEIEDASWLDGIDFTPPPGMTFFTSNRPLRGSDEDG